MIVISDTSPVVALFHLGRLDLLQRLYGEVVIPPAVAAELAAGTPKWKPIDLGEFPFISLRAPSERARVESLRRRIDPGESEAIVLALECRADLLLIDDREGRAVADELGVRYTGTIGTLIRAKNNGLVAEIRPLLDEIVAKVDFYLSDALRQEALRRAGEPDA